MGLDKKEKKKLRKKHEHNILLLLVATVLLLGIIFILILPNDEKWVQNGNKISKKDETYNIGDYYQYDATNDNQIKGLTDVKWKVMGVDEKGNLLIVSASSVETITLGKKDDVEKTQKDYKEGIEKINTIAEKYGSGTNALGARSITIEDINKITKYDLNELDQYGLTTTYYWGNESNPKSKTENQEIYDIKIPHNNKFIWFDEETDKWMSSTKDPSKNYDTLEEIVTLKTNHIAYNNYRYDETIKGNRDYMDSTTPEYKMLFLEDNGEKSNYWTTDRYVIAIERYASFGYNTIKGADVNYNTLIYSSGNLYEITAGVRVVVTID